MPEHLAREIDIFETEAHLRKQGKLDGASIPRDAASRGIYGQRLTRPETRREKGSGICVPSGDLTKARIRLGTPRHAAHQDPWWWDERQATRALRNWPRKTPTASAHVTTRQDFQLHYTT